MCRFSAQGPNRGTRPCTVSLKLGRAPGSGHHMHTVTMKPRRADHPALCFREQPRVSATLVAPRTDSPSPHRWATASGSRPRRHLPSLSWCVCFLRKQLTRPSPWTAPLSTQCGHRGPQHVPHAPPTAGLSLCPVTAAPLCRASRPPQPQRNFWGALPSSCITRLVKGAY